MIHVQKTVDYYKFNFVSQNARRLKEYAKLEGNINSIIENNSDTLLLQEI